MENAHLGFAFPPQSSSEALATFSLPAGLSYPVQIPAGVTLQTASGNIVTLASYLCISALTSPAPTSGQLYKVNVPVVVTQAAAGQRPANQQKATERREAPSSQSAAPPASTTRCQEAEPSGFPRRPAASDDAPHAQLAECPEPQVSAGETHAGSQAEPIDLTGSSPSGDELFDFQMAAEEPSTHGAAPLKGSDIDDILQRVIEEERLKAEMARNLACEKPGGQSDELLGVIFPGRLGLE